MKLIFEITEDEYLLYLNWKKELIKQSNNNILPCDHFIFTPRSSGVNVSVLCGKNKIKLRESNNEGN